MDDIVLGYADVDAYRASRDYMGCVVGRFAGRIARGRFTVGGKVFALAPNDGENVLHGGAAGFNTAEWRSEPVRTSEGKGARCTLSSPDGDQGFPGEVSLSVTYVWSDDCRLIIDFAATTTRTTPFNVTQHSYWNLRGSGSATNVQDHWLAVAAGAFLPLDQALLPAGEMRSVEGTPFDLRTPRRIGDCLGAEHPQLRLAGGFDHCWVLDGSGLRQVAELSDPRSGRRMTIATDQPGLQVYTGNALGGGAVGKHGRPYQRHAGIALETQHFPDSPNHLHFPDTMLRPERPFRSRTIFAFSSD